MFGNTVTITITSDPDRCSAASPKSTTCMKFIGVQFISDINVSRKFLFTLSQLSNISCYLLQAVFGYLSL